MKEGTNEMKKNTKKSSSYEPFFYIAFVLKGTEKHYLDLLKHIEEHSGAELIYQTKSLTYLYISKGDAHKNEALADMPMEIRS
jgi:hypothetical protein